MVTNGSSWTAFAIDDLEWLIVSSKVSYQTGTSVQGIQWLSCCMCNNNAYYSYVCFDTLLHGKLKLEVNF